MDEKKFSIENADKFGKYYSDDNFWAKVKKIASKAGRQIIQPALELYYVLLSQDVPIKSKGIIIGALGYLILPTDLIPDFIPILGFGDDATALALALKMVSDNVTPEIKAKAEAKANEIFGC
ncbi:MAG: DUF1232 domain-containing protein [Bacteroidales bacterium]|nr:DUF1232 domain-containing protein [Bacteroidales bacterium]